MGSPALANPAAVKAILPSYIKITQQAASKVTLGTYPSTLDPAELQQVLTLMKSGGLPTTGLTASALLFH